MVAKEKPAIVPLTGWPRIAVASVKELGPNGCVLAMLVYMVIFYLPDLQKSYHQRAKEERAEFLHEIQEQRKQTQELERSLNNLVKVVEKSETAMASAAKSLERYERTTADLLRLVERLDHDRSGKKPE